MTRETVKSRQQVYFSESDINYDDLTEICSQKTLKEDYSLSDSVSKNVVIYDANHLKSFIVNELKERVASGVRKWTRSFCCSKSL